MSPSTGCSFSRGVMRLLKRRKRTAVMMLSNALTSWFGARRPMTCPMIVYMTPVNMRNGMIDTVNTVSRPNTVMPTRRTTMTCMALIMPPVSVDENWRSDVGNGLMAFRNPALLTRSFMTRTLPTRMPTKDARVVSIPGNKMSRIVRFWSSSCRFTSTLTGFTALSAP